MKQEAVNKFLEYLNKELSPCLVAEFRKHAVGDDIEVVAFSVQLATNKYIRSGVVNFTEEYEKLVIGSCKKFFDKEPNFNNTGGIFYF